MFSEFGKFLLEGGVAVWMMLLLAGFGVAVGWERTQSLFFKYSIDLNGFMNKLRPLVLSDKIEEAIAFCSSQRKEALLPHVAKAILERADRDDESIKTAQELSTQEIVPKVTQRMGYLAMIANVATLIGLLGTIHGLIQSFQAISFADPSQKQTLLAQGISISMNTTALGLLVAIPVMVLYAFLQARMNKILEDIIGGSAQVVDLLISRNQTAFSETTAFASGETAPPAPRAGTNGHAKRKSA
ncbi:MAG: MotA/TolQ/ExbB proton channel family protein [Oligoflexia bacterium]|nr:MotA/TolQ/ExbB proton channel family protein [Oligoflexia bacterium]